MYISLSSSHAGNACAIKQSITNYYKPEETQIFDWLVCSMKSVNQLLEGMPILVGDYVYPNAAGTTTVNFLNYHLLVSHHDMYIYNEDSKNKLIEKYERRYKRFINTLKEQKEIFFIRYSKNSNDIETEEITKFCKYITNINNILRFKFILISDSDNLKIDKCLFSNEKFIYINLNKYINNDLINEQTPYFKIIKLYKCVFDLTNK